MLPALPDTQLARLSLFLNVRGPVGTGPKSKKAVPGSSDGPWSTAGSAPSLVWRKADDRANRNRAANDATGPARGADDTHIRRQDETVHAAMLCSAAFKVKFIMF